MPKITKTTVDALQSGDTIIDEALPGFCVRAGATCKTYFVQRRVGAKVRKLTIGRHGVFTPDSARKQAQLLLAQLAIGNDPQAEKKAQRQKDELTFGRLMDEYLERRRLKPTTVKDTRDRVGRLLGDWLKKPANDITRAMVRDRFRKLTEDHPTQAALTARYARAIFNYGIDEYRDDRTGESAIRQNPIEVITRGRADILAKPTRRKTYLKDRQLPAFFEALRNIRPRLSERAQYVEVTLLTGARRSEIACLKWADVDLNERTITFRDTKNGRDHLLPLTSRVHEILTARDNARKKPEPYVFPLTTKAEKRVIQVRSIQDYIKEATGIEFLMHDLRRTYATAADALDLNDRTVKRLMNHTTNEDADVTLGYMIREVERLREPAQMIEDYILTKAGIKPESDHA